MDSHLTGLPDDALGLILARVPGDLQPVASTCRRLRDACASAPVLIGFLAAAVRAADEASAGNGRDGNAGTSTAAVALRSVPPLLAAIKWRATRPLRAEPQALAEFCCALVDALTPVGGRRDLVARRGARRQDRRAPLGGRAVSEGGSRGPPVPRAGVARMGCDAPHARPFLHAALAHCRRRRPIHALVALASALPPVLQPMLLPFLAAGGHAAACLRLLDAEGCLDQPGCLGGRFDLDLGGGAGPGALLAADHPLLPRLRAAARADRLGLREGEDEWWWWWLPRGVGGGGGGEPARSPEEEAGLLRGLEVSGLRCLRWALWEPVRLGDRPPRGMPPCAGGGSRRAAVAPLAMALAATVRVVAADAGGRGRPPPSPSSPSSSSPLCASSRRLLWALTEATMFARVFRHHASGPWWRWSPLYLPGTGPVDEPEEPLGAAEAADEAQGEKAVAGDDEGLGAARGNPRFAAFGGQSIDPETRAQRRRAWRLRGRLAFLDGSGDGPGDAGACVETADGAGAAAPPRPPERREDFPASASSSEEGGESAADGGGSGTGAPPPPPLLPWASIVADVSRATQAAEAAAAASATAAAAARRPSLASVYLLDPSAWHGNSSWHVRHPTADPVGAHFGPPDDPLALPALVEMAACAGGATALRDAWAEAGGARGAALFARSCERAHLLAALAYGGGGGGGGGGGKGDSADDAEAGLFRRAMAGAFHPSPAHVEPSFKDALCAAGEAGSERAMRLLVASPRLTFNALSGALARACGGAAYRIPHPPATPEAWHPAGATLSPALSPPSSREWPGRTLDLLLGALTGQRFREEAAEALAPALSICLSRRPADRERTLRRVWAALTSVPVAAENLASRTGQRLAPTSGRGSGAVEGRGEPRSILALLAARGDAERVEWIVKNAPTAAFKARAYPVLLAFERGHDKLAQRILDAPRVSDGFGAGARQAEARGRVYAAARRGRADEARDALRDVQIVARSAWWSPLLAEMIANAATMAAREREDEHSEDEEDGGGLPRPHMRVLRLLVIEATRRLEVADAFAALLAIALGKGWSGVNASSSGSSISSGSSGDAGEGESDGALLPRRLAQYFPYAVRALCPGGEDPTFGATRLALVAALLADGSPRALDAIARLERAGESPSPSLGLDVGLLLARHCQLRWPATTPQYPVAELEDSCYDLEQLAACGGPPGGWLLPSERPFPAGSVLSAACRPGGPVALAIQEARASALASAGRAAAADDDDDDDGDGEDGEEGPGDRGDRGVGRAPAAADDDGFFLEPNEDAYAEAQMRRDGGLLARVRTVLVGRSDQLAPPPLPLPDPLEHAPAMPPHAPPRCVRCPATHDNARPWPDSSNSRVQISRAASPAVQARGGDLPLACAALVAWRGARALLDAQCVWESFGCWADADDAADPPAPLWRAPPGGPPLAPVVDVDTWIPRQLDRGAEVAAELDPS